MIVLIYFGNQIRDLKDQAKSQKVTLKRRSEYLVEKLKFSSDISQELCRNIFSCFNDNNNENIYDWRDC